MRATNRLSSQFLKSAPVGKHCDGAGLWLIKRDDGGAQWVQLWPWCSPRCVNGAGFQKGDNYLRDTTCVAGGLNVVVTSSQNRNIAISAPA
jgi:hypothetical protein